MVIKDLLQIEDYLISHCRGRKNGNQIMFQCPTPEHPDNNPSASYNIDDKIWKCFSCNASGGYKKLCELLGLDLELNLNHVPSSNPLVTKHGTHNHVLSSPSKGIEHRTHKCSYKITNSWDIKDSQEMVIGKHHRSQCTSCEKKTYTWSDHNNTSSMDMPLYGTHHLDSDNYKRNNYLIIVEGEKSVDALHNNGLNSLGTVTGASTIPNQHIFESIVKQLTGKTIYLWADNDGIGRKHMHKISMILKKLNLTYSFIDYRQIKEKGDAFDYIKSLPEGSDIKEKIGGLMNNSTSTSPFLSDRSQNDLFKISSIRDVMNTPTEDYEFIWGTQIYQSSTSIIASEPKTGKTQFCLSLAKAITHGEDFLGMATKQMRCHYLYLEGDVLDLQDRLEGLNVDQDNGLFTFWTSVAPMEMNRMEWLREYIEMHNPKLVIIDMMLKFSNTINDSNNYTEMMQLFTQFDEVAKSTKCAIILTHHLKKGQVKTHNIERVLGSTAITGGVDSIFMMSRLDDGKRKFSSQLRGIKRESIEVPIIVGMDEEGKLMNGGTVDVLAETNARTKIREVVLSLEDGELITTTQLREKCGGNTSIHNRIKKEMLSTGELVTEDDGKKKLYSNQSYVDPEDVSDINNEELHEEWD